MKKLYFLFLSFVCIHSGWADKSVVSESKVTEVKLFFQGAEVKRTAELDLKKGKNYFEIQGLSSSIDITSLNLGLNPAYKILSAYIDSGAGSNDLNNELLKAKQKLTALNSELSLFKLQLEALEGEKESLLKNSTRIGTSHGMSLTELDNTLAYLRKKQEEINILITNKEKDRRDKEEEAKILQNRITEIEKRKEVASATLYLTLETESTLIAHLSFSYYVWSCAWAPFYNIFNKGSSEPLLIEYKANILNNSGEDWQRVKISLIPGNPSGSLEVPQLSTWTLAYSQRTRSGKVRTYDQSGSEGSFSKQQIKNGQNQNGSNLEYREIQIEEGFEMFDIDGVHDIASSNHAYKVDIASFTKNALYYYQAVPKIENKAYLIAKLNDWEDMQIIEGEANVYSNYTFTGRTYINPLSAGDTLEISLGPDPAIQITRVKKKDKSSRRFIGLQLTESLAYEIDIRNLNKKPVYIEIIDQIPVAQQSDIQISLEESDGAIYSAYNGKLSWALEIPPVNTAKIKMGYSVKYPRDKIVIIKRTANLVCPSHFW